jgi:ferric-dicitrate binding protein FerR (iron transport regulator)
VGDGSFDVNHEADRPFYVHMGQLHIKVLGTSFAVSRTKETVNVSVNKGLVAFYNAKDTLLVPEGNMGSYIKDDGKFVLTPFTGSFLFNNTPMSEVASQIGAHFKVKVQFGNAAFKDCKLSAGFENQTLKEILSAISATFNTGYKIEGNVVQLSGNACK